MKIKTITVINQKGGVGKSTTVLSIGAGLILQGHKVLYVDLDAQCNLTYTIGASAKIKPCNIFDVLQNPNKIHEGIQSTKNGDIIAGTIELSGADMLITQTGKEYRLREALEKIANQYDYCVIDTPPALGILTINALTASDGAIIPAQADIYSLHGISQLSNTIQAVQKYCNHGLKIMGIVITRFNKRSIIRKEIAEMLEETAKQLNTQVYKTKIRECTALVESQATKQNIYEYAKKSNAALDYKELVKEILASEN